MSRVGLGCRSYGNAAAGMHQWTLGEDAAAPFFRQERDATLLVDIAPDCVMGSVQPTPDGTRYEGYDASFQLVEGAHRRHHPRAVMLDMRVIFLDISAGD